jgi:hypothetical protein
MGISQYRLIAAVAAHQEEQTNMEVTNKRTKKLADLEHHIAQSGLGDPSSAAVVIAVYRIVRTLLK